MEAVLALLQGTLTIVLQVPQFGAIVPVVRHDPTAHPHTNALVLVQFHVKPEHAVHNVGFGGTIMGASQLRFRTEQLEPTKKVEEGGRRNKRQAEASRGKPRQAKPSQAMECEVGWLVGWLSPTVIPHTSNELWYALGVIVPANDHDVAVIRSIARGTVIKDCPLGLNLEWSWSKSTQEMIVFAPSYGGGGCPTLPAPPNLPFEQWTESFVNVNGFFSWYCDGGRCEQGPGPLKGTMEWGVVRWRLLKIPWTSWW